MGRSVRSRPKGRYNEAEKMAHDMFRQAAGAQRCCQMCGKGGSDWHPHHVVYAQHLKLHGHPIYDTRNAMRLCIRCHQRHHNRSAVIPLTKLLDCHYQYAFEKLGLAARYYLEQRYDGEDERLARFEAECEQQGGEDDERRSERGGSAGASAGAAI